MTSPVAPIVGLGLRALELVLQRAGRDPAARAAACNHRARLLELEADVVSIEAKHHDLSSLTGDKESRRFHLRRARKLFRKKDRLRSRSLWWSMRAKKWEHSTK
jgi:hypothetical protein